MGVRIIEHDPAGTIHVEGISDDRRIEVLANVRIEGQTGYLDQLHIDGPGAGSIGLIELRSFAVALGRQLGVARLVIQDGRRTTGAKPGHIPRAISIRVE